MCLTLYQVLTMAAAVAQTLPMKVHPRLRAGGEIVDIPVAGGWMPTGGGRDYCIVSPAVRKGTGARLGDMLQAWMKFTPGQRRGHAYRVAQAKTIATLQWRIEAVLDALGEQGRVRIADLRSIHEVEGSIAPCARHLREARVSLDGTRMIS